MCGLQCYGVLSVIMSLKLRCYQKILRLGKGLEQLHCERVSDFVQRRRHVALRLFKDLRQARRHRFSAYPFEPARVPLTARRMWSFIKNQIESAGIALDLGADASAQNSSQVEEQQGSRLSAADAIYEESIKFLSTGRFVEAAASLSNAVAHSHPRSHGDLSWLLLWGRDGVFIDYRKAFQLAESGHRLGCDWSKGALALCYLCGRGVAPDEALGFDLASECASTSYGQFCLGYAHLYGIGGAPKKSALAIRHFASAQGNAEAQHYVGHMLENGNGIPPNKAEAITWYRAAAAQGHSAAIVSLQRLLPRKLEKSALETYINHFT